MSQLDVPVILGTARPGRRSEAVATTLVDMIKERDWLTDLVDVAEYELTATATPGAGTDLDLYRERIAAADGFVIVAPEYNHGYPGELKLLLDSDSAGYRRKPVGLVGVSAGRLGGARMVEQLQNVVLALGMIPVRPTVHVPEVQSALDESGGFADDGLGDVAREMLDEIGWYGEALRR